MNNLHLYFSPFGLILLLFLSVFSIRCSEKRVEEKKYLYKDDLNRVVKANKQPVRVMALSSSITEMLSLLCDEQNIVARTQNCDYPPSILKKQVISNYPIDYEGLLKVNPDMVFAKEGIISLEEAAKMEGMGIPVYFQKYDNVEDILKGISDLGKILGKEVRTSFVVDSIRKDIQRLQSNISSVNRPRVLILISSTQIFAFGKESYASDLLKQAGAINAIDERFSNAYPQLTTEYILKLNPDILIGVHGAVGLEDGSFFEQYPELKRLSLYSSKDYFSFPEDLISRPGPRVGETIRHLIKIIHTDVK